MKPNDNQPHICRCSNGESFGDRRCANRAAALEYARKVEKDGGQAYIFPANGPAPDPVRDAGPEEGE